MSLSSLSPHSGSNSRNVFNSKGEYTVVAREKKYTKTFPLCALYISTLSLVSGSASHKYTCHEVVHQEWVHKWEKPYNL